MNIIEDELLKFFTTYRKTLNVVRPMVMSESWKLYNREHAGMGGGTDYPHNAHIHGMVERLQELMP